MPNRFPEIHDLVAVTVGCLDYFGYVSDIDYDMRDPRLKVEFEPNSNGKWFVFADCRLVDFPKDIN